MAVGSAFAQQTELKALYESKSYDNWYLGINGGLTAKTTHVDWKDNYNGNGGLRVGRWFTPVFGLMIEGNAYVGDKPQPDTGTLVKYVNTAVGTTINLSNWLCGYNGKPRVFELIAVPAVGMGHVFGNESKVSHGLNDMTGKLALDLAFNVDKKKSLQVYLEPALLYSIYGNTCNSDEFKLDINRSHFQVNLGVAYKFKNTNGTHNFKYAEPVEIVDQTEINRLNDIINDLRAENEALRNRPVEQVAPKQVYVEKEMLEPVVVFKVNSSNIEADQYANIEKVANYMKKNSSTKVLVKGYASTDGGKEFNQQLSENRASIVRAALIDKYGIAADRVSCKGFGATDQQSGKREFNRVSVFCVTE